MTNPRTNLLHLDPPTADERTAIWTMALHKDCREADHLNCLQCGTLICTTDDSPTRASMYRSHPVCPDCKDRRGR